MRAMIILQIERADIEADNLAGTLEKLHILSNSIENALLYRECLAFVVHGYDEDRRALAEIPEVREFFKKLVQEWPHWLWFLHRGIGAISLLLSLLCVIEIHQASDESHVNCVDYREISVCIIDLFERSNTMLVAFNMTERDAKRSADSAMAEIFGSDENDKH